MNAFCKTVATLTLTLLALATVRAESPSDSLYRLDIAMTDQDGHSFRLADRAGKPQLVSMFYASCQYTCPLIVEALKRNQNALPPQDRPKLDLLLVSFDSARDTPQRLKQVVTERHIDSPNWTLAHADESAIRTLAAALDFKYRKLPSGDYSHSSEIVLLSADGRILARTDQLDGTNPEFLDTLRKTLDSEKSP
jgi:protein SCO1/2